MSEQYGRKGGDVAEPYYVIIITDYYYSSHITILRVCWGPAPDLVWLGTGSLSPGCGQNKYLIPNHCFWALFSIISSVHNPLT